MAHAYSFSINRNEISLDSLDLITFSKLNCNYCNSIQTKSDANIQVFRNSLIINYDNSINDSTGNIFTKGKR